MPNIAELERDQDLLASEERFFDRAALEYTERHVPRFRHFETITIDKPAELEKVYRKIEDLRRHFVDESIVVSADSRLSARRWAAKFYGEAMRMGTWVTPHITPDESGDIAFEWWRNKKKLTIYVGEWKADAFLTDYATADGKIMEANASSTAERAEIWKWFIS
jgi:hypothetical protein